MRRPFLRFCAILQIGLMLLTGCHPTQPFFVERNASLANYIAQSTDIEYADAHIDSLPEATDTTMPFGPRNLPNDYIDLTLEDCMSMALNNAKILRVVGGYNSQTGAVSSALLSAQPGQMPSVFDPAIVSSTSSTQALAIDSQGTRVAQRGAVRANQVGGVEDALAEFDAQFSALFGYNTTDRPRNVAQGNVFNPQLFQAVDANGQAALSKRHATGTITTARFTTVYSRNNIPAPGLGRAVPSDYTAALELQLNQPLMRGRGTLINRIPLMLARMNEELATHEFEVNVRNLLQSVEHAYWDLYCDYRAYDSSLRARDLAKQVENVATDKANVGPGEPAAASNARARYFQFEAQMKAALYGTRVPGNDPDGIFGSERRLRNLIGWGATDGRCIRPSDSPSIARVHFSWHDVVGEALTRNTEVRRQKWAIKQDELELISARNQVLPQLDMVAFYRWLGVGDTLGSDERSGIAFPGAGSNAFEGLTSGDFQEIGARLEFTPQAFAKRRAMANIQFSRLQLKKNQVEGQEKEIMLVFELADAWGRIDSSFELMHTYWQQAAEHEQEIHSYEVQLREGVAQDQGVMLDQLLRAEELRARAELQYYQSICEYNKAIVNLHALKGSLLDLNGVALQEGAWVDKAYWDAEERARERAGGIYFDYGYTRPNVISNGPVGGEGFIGGSMSDHGDAPAVIRNEINSGAEIIEAVPSIMDDDTPPAPSNTDASQASYRSQVAPASATGNQSGESFDWGELGSASRQRTAAPQAARPAERHSISDRPSTGSANSPTQRVVHQATTNDRSGPNWTRR